MLKAEEVGAAVEVYKVILQSYKKTLDDHLAKEPIDMYWNGAYRVCKSLMDEFYHLFKEEMPTAKEEVEDAAC